MSSSRSGGRAACLVRESSRSTCHIACERRRRTRAGLAWYPSSATLQTLTVTQYSWSIREPLGPCSLGPVGEETNYPSTLRGSGGGRGTPAPMSNSIGLTFPWARARTWTGLFKPARMAALGSRKESYVPAPHGRSPLAALLLRGEIAPLPQAEADLDSLLRPTTRHLCCSALRIPIWFRLRRTNGYTPFRGGHRDSSSIRGRALCSSGTG